MLLFALHAPLSACCFQDLRSSVVPFHLSELLSAWASIRHLQLTVEVVSAAQRDSVGEKASWGKSWTQCSCKGARDRHSFSLLGCFYGREQSHSTRQSSAGICHRTRTPTNTAPCSKTGYSSGVFIRNETAQSGSFVHKTFLIKTHKEKL